MTYRTHDNAQSRAAGEKHKKEKSRKDRRAICEYLARMAIDGGCDDDIIRACPDIHPNALRMRLAELKDQYLFITLELAVRKKNASGNWCRVWHITAKGLEALGLDPQTNWNSETKAVL